MHAELSELFSSPGLSQDGVEDLQRRLPGLPASYVDCVRRLDVVDMPLGDFRFSPATHPELEALGLIEIASAGGDSLCLERAGDGRVLWIRDEPVPREIAPSFADTLLILARFDAAQWGDEGPVELDALVEDVELTDEQRANLRQLLGL